MGGGGNSAVDEYIAVVLCGAPDKQCESLHVRFELAKNGALVITLHRDLHLMLEVHNHIPSMLTEIPDFTKVLNSDKDIFFFFKQIHFP